MSKSPLHQRTKRQEDPVRHGWRFGLFIVESHLALYKQKLTKSSFPRVLRFAALDLGSAMPMELKSTHFLGCPPLFRASKPVHWATRSFSRLSLGV